MDDMNLSLCEHKAEQLLLQTCAFMINCKKRVTDPYIQSQFTFSSKDRPVVVQQQVKDNM